MAKYGYGPQGKKKGKGGGPPPAPPKGKVKGQSAGGHKGTEAEFGRAAEKWGVAETTVSFEGHVMERMLSYSLIKAVMRAGHLRVATTGALGKLGVQFLERAYSQENELRADTLGVRLAAAAGYDPGGAIDLFLHLESLHESTRLGQYFSTHPSCQSRIENIRRVRKEMV